MKSPKALGLPFRDWRPGQRGAIRTILSAKRTHVVINAPTGSGKSTIAMALPKLAPKKRHVILTATLGLQDQYGNTAPWLDDLRGMSNYECLAAKDEFKSFYSARRLHVTVDDGPCHDGAQCSLKEGGCTYYDRRREFTASQNGLTNYPAWLSNRRFGQGLGQADVVVCDEAHALPEQLMSSCRIEIPTNLFDARAPTGYKKWRSWAHDKLNDIRSSDADRDADTRHKRTKLEEALRCLTKIDATWAWDAHESHFVFEPTIPKLLLPLLHTFDQHSTVVYLSATITPATLRLLDIKNRDLTFETMESTFPLNRRPIYLRNRVRVDWRSMKNEYQHEQWMNEIDDWIEQRTDRNGIIHTQSFERAYDIWNHSRYKSMMIMHHRGKPGAEVVQYFKEQGKYRPCILISPSVTTGYDFKYTEAEHQIIAKMPFPDTRSRISQARCKATPGYRDWITATTLMQACGRINRADDDSGETLIVDAHAQWFLREHEDLLAPWFAEAIVRTGRRIRPLPKLAA